MHLEEACQRYLDHLQIIQFASLHTLRNYRLDLSRFSLFMDATTPIASIKRSHIRQYLSFLHEKGLSKRTVARHLASLRSLFRHGQKQQWIQEDPMALMENPKVNKTIPSTLTYPQIERLLNQPDPSTLFGMRDKTILELFYSSGIRLSELVGLNRQDIDTDPCWMSIRGKGRKERVVPITPQAAHWIIQYTSHIEYPRDSSALFLNKWGSRISGRSVDRLFKKYLHMSGLVGSITPHSIRHTIATHWLENNMNLKVIQEILGHSSPSTTTLYAKVSPQLSKQVHQKLHPRG